MDSKIKNLSNQEEYIIISLSNCAYQVNLYLDQLKKLKQEYPDNIDKKEFHRFKRVFKYYKKHLIPAIQEFAKIEQKYLNLILKNPDPDFTPILEEFNFQKDLMTRFRNRFEEIHKEFYQFCMRTKTI